MSQRWSLTFEWLFSDSHSLLQVSSLLSLYGPWSWGTSYYATHVGTMVCCYGDCQGSQSIIGVYSRQEQGYSPSIRICFNLAHSLDHTLRSTQLQRNKGKRTTQSSVDVILWIDYSVFIFLKKDLVQTLSCWFNASLQGLFLERTDCEQKEANWGKRETRRDY